MKKITVFILILIGVLIYFLKTNITTMEKIEVGDKIPTFVLQDQNGNPFHVSSAHGKPMVIYFYPKDETAGCIKEACKFRDEFEDFLALNTLVIGISSDNVASHKKFEKKYNLPFTLLADTKNEVRKLFGVPKSMLFLPGRVTYVVDKNGIVQYIFNSQFRAEKHIENALLKLKKI